MDTKTSPLFDLGYSDPTRVKRWLLELEAAKVPNPNVPSLIQNTNNLVANTLQGALDPWGQVVLPTAGAVKDLAISGWDSVKKSAPGEIVNNAAEAMFVPQKKVQARLAQEEQAVRDAQAAQTAAELNKINTFDAVMSGLGSQSSQSGTIPLGPAQASFGGYTLPPPPQGADYSGVQEAIDQTKPDPIDADVESKRRGAILTGLVGGVLQASLDENNSFGQILGNAGIGVLQGMGQADAYQSESKEKFKAAMDEYWMRTANVRKSQAESDQDYIQRVYNTKLAQMEINSKASIEKAKAGASQLIHENGKYFIQETVQTPQGAQKQLRPIEIDSINKLAGMETHMTALLGGTEDAKKKAQAIVAETMATKNPEYALPMVTIARMKTNGRYLDFVEKLSQLEPTFLKQFTSVGSMVEGSANMDAKQLTEMADRRRDALLMDLMLHSDTARAMAYDAAGMLEQRLKGVK
jgi:hypothetical protein